MTTSKPQDSKPKNTATRSTKEPSEAALEALAAGVEAVTLELRNMKDIRTRLDEKELELQNIKDALAASAAALAASEAALAESEAARRAANPERVLLPEHLGKQEVFVVLRFRNPQPLPDGAYRLFTLQREAVRSTLNKFIADNPSLDAVEMDELRLDPSPRGEYVYQYMRDDKEAPIEFSRRIFHNFVIKEDYTENKMKDYILSVLSTHTRED